MSGELSGGGVQGDECKDPSCTCPYPWPQGAKLVSEMKMHTGEGGGTFFYMETTCPGHRGRLIRRLHGEKR